MSVTGRGSGELPDPARHDGKERSGRDRRIVLGRVIGMKEEGVGSPTYRSCVSKYLHAGRGRIRWERRAGLGSSQAGCRLAGPLALDHSRQAEVALRLISAPEPPGKLSGVLAGIPSMSARRDRSPATSSRTSPRTPRHPLIDEERDPDRPVVRSLSGRRASGRHPRTMLPGIANGPVFGVARHQRTCRHGTTADDPSGFPRRVARRFYAATACQHITARIRETSSFTSNLALREGRWARAR